MADVVSASKRSEMMSGIRGKDTRPEMIVRKYLHSSGLRYRLHCVDLPGKPDLVMRGRRVAIFVHGCFWHRHCGCRYATTPTTRREFWVNKLERNRERDASAISELLTKGWRVAIVWECSIRHSRLIALRGLVSFVHSSESFHESSPG
ncbi:TPA: DNA mismatch endonuclease Vsr [Stenotrophomonas maltophilia]|jgi:DNA mismatch endonuclease (patch repair protein)|nr:DNA mismatch endonuclease Vsr [Stenotrophomonas maltophilia]